MQKFFKSIQTDKITYWGFIISLILIFLGLGMTLVFFKNLPPFLPIYNKLPWGYARIGMRWEIFLPCGITFIIYITNLFISAKIYEKVPLLARILCATTIAASILYFIFIVQLIYLIK